jgi:NAD(P)-dependent dehydrogenase (short-subunit alcohol dehydrogenase family)
MGKRFLDKVVWITGGGSGIGRELALAFGREGAAVAVSGRRTDRLDQVTGQLDSLGARGIAVPCDATKEDELEQAVQSVVEHLGRLDVAVANAGFAMRGLIESLSAEDWRRQLDINVVGLAVTARHALPHLRKTRGRLALVGSTAAFLAAPRAGAYTASKYAVRAIGQTLSIELHGSGVSCTTVHPGYVASEIGQVDNQGRFHPDRKDKRPARLMWPTDKAARVIVNAIYRRKRDFVFTGHGKFGAWAGQHLPGAIHFVMTRQKRKAKKA